MTTTMTPATLGAPAPLTPDWWRDTLLRELARRRATIELNERYHSGDHPLPNPPAAMDTGAFEESKRIFQQLSKLGRTNLMPLVAKAPADRLSIRGFRLGETIGGDTPAWRIWQRNHLDADHRLMIDGALESGQTYALVWGDGDGKAVITPEHPLETILAYEPGDRRKRAAGLKCWKGDWEDRLFVNLYLPDGVYKWQSRSKRASFGAALGLGDTWVKREAADEPWPMPNPLGEVSIVELAANAGLKPRPFGGGKPEFHDVLVVQDRINKGVFDRLVTGEHQAYRQRYTIGWEPPVDPATGQPDPVSVMRAGLSRMPNFPKDTEVGEFAQSDFKGFYEGFNADVTILATMSLTPQSYLPLDMKNLGADTITQTMVGFISKTMRHSSHFGEQFEEIMRLALKVEGEVAADDVQSQVLWDNIEVRTLGEKVDAAVKKLSLGVPPEVLWADLGYAQTDINLWKALGAANTFGQAEPAQGAAAGQPAIAQ